jgi:hypothetical protein
VIQLTEPGWLYQLNDCPSEEVDVYTRAGWLKYRLFTDMYGLRHGELRQYRENGEVALRELYVNGTRKNCLLTTNEDRMYAALIYGVPLLQD